MESKFQPGDFIVSIYNPPNHITFARVISVNQKEDSIELDMYRINLAKMYCDGKVKESLEETEDFYKHTASEDRKMFYSFLRNKIGSFFRQGHMLSLETFDSLKQKVLEDKIENYMNNGQDSVPRSSKGKGMKDERC